MKMKHATETRIRTSHQHKASGTKASCTAACLAFSLFGWHSPVFADMLLGIYAGVGGWQADYNGEFASEGSNIDVDADLAIDGDHQSFIYVALEHPIPLLPNVKISKTDLKNSSTTQLSSTISFEGSTFTSGESVETDLDLSHTDFVAYYEILDNWVSLDAGFTARHFTGDASITGNTLAESADLDAWVPMGYLKAQFDLPLTGLYAGGEVNAISFNDNRITDYSLRIGFDTALRLGVELGYRSMMLELKDVDDQDFVSDLEMDGAYLALTLHI
ncbi:MAG: TIGR04219 family outer membrane beta-barrel protein [Gammaproteobacteria bacterium]